MGGLGAGIHILYGVSVGRISISLGNNHYFKEKNIKQQFKLFLHASSPQETTVFILIQNVRDRIVVTSVYVKSSKSTELLLEIKMEKKEEKKEEKKKNKKRVLVRICGLLVASKQYRLLLWFPAPLSQPVPLFTSIFFMPLPKKTFC